MLPLRAQMVRSMEDLKRLTPQEKLTFSRPAAPYEAWTPGYVDDTPETVVLDDASIEMSKRRKMMPPETPPIAAQPLFPILSNLRKRLR